MKKLLPLTVLPFIAGCTATEKKDTPQHPNIIFVMADDLGYGEPGCYGQEEIRTPNLDELAAEGMRFTQFYAGSTVSAPSRGCLMTGMHTGHITNRINFKMNIYHETGVKERIGIKQEDTTIAQLLNQAGYFTSIYGKWHLEKPSDTTTHPRNKGFDYELFPLIGSKYGHGFYPEALTENGKMREIPANQNGKRGYYIDDFLIDQSIITMKKYPGQSHFIYLSLKTPHAPTVIEDDTSYADKGWHEMKRKHAARITRMDQAIGRLLHFLDSSGLAKNSLVIFTSDNGSNNEGGHNYMWFNSSAPFKGCKRDLYEGGIRVPMIARWPGVIVNNTESDFIGAFWDFMPTFCEIAGIQPPKNIDGISFLPELKGETLDPERYLYWEFYEKGGRQAIRYKKWKAIRYGVQYNPDTAIMLFNIEKDTMENNDVSKKHPELIKKFNRFMSKAHTPYEHVEWTNNFEVHPE